MGETMENDSRKTFEETERAMYGVFAFHEATRERFDDACASYVGTVNPRALREEEPSEEELRLSNLCFTEFYVYEYRALGLMGDRCAIDNYLMGARGYSDETGHVLESIRDSQLFSKFGIVDKSPEDSMVTLRDVTTGTVRDVFDPVTAGRRSWRSGAVCERIACVDGRWVCVGRVRFYDRAELVYPSGAPTPETVGLDFLATCHDIIGFDGRYSMTARVVG